MFLGDDFITVLNDVTEAIFCERKGRKCLT